jgi:hypothetical protein
MVTLEQYKQAAAARDRRGCYASAVLLVSLVTFLLGPPLVLGLLLRPYGDAWVEACAQWVVRHDISPDQIKLIGLLAVLPIAVAGGLVLALPICGVWRLIQRGNPPDRRLLCPHCGALLGYLVAVTGNCPSCGGHALDIPERDPATTGPGGRDQRLLTVEEFNAAVRNRFRPGDPKHPDPRLRCPRCQEDLVRRRFQVVATRKCPRCEAPVLEDPDTPTPAGSPPPAQVRLSLAGFRAAHPVYVRRSLLVGVLLLCLVFVPAILVACWPAPLQRFLGETGPLVLGFGVFLLGWSLLASVATLIEYRLRRKLHLNCPHCDQSLYSPGGIVIATRRCPHCGRRALAEEGEPAAASAANEP